MRDLRNPPLPEPSAHDFPYGQYSMLCRKCQTRFSGPKLQPTCKVCTDAAHAAFVETQDQLISYSLRTKLAGTFPAGLLKVVCDELARTLIADMEVAGLKIVRDEPRIEQSAHHDT